MCLSTSLFSTHARLEKIQVKRRDILSRIDGINIDIDKYGAPFDNYNQKLTKAFTDNDRIPLQRQQIDSLNILYRNYIKSIDRGIHKLETFQEVDTTFKVVAANMAFLQHQRKLWDKMGSPYLKMYSTGWYNLSTEEQNAFVEFINELKEDQSLTHKLSDSVNYVSRELGKKYGFEYVLESRK
ncbi:hypothetical protein [Agriterribacter sp.]|uniref:hypothetical protein n=1 Tax=Agriterribacter sp. TaxID=2821509 RepID=UPI002C09C4CC|nr:hypothetical protein [Agriterribacter sp.]HRO46600.1 hypothetical protein [Agriterribacter sp.]HRQ18038.1 hypothetical protein [Agriterribacter sp.]